MILEYTPERIEWDPFAYNSKTPFLSSGLICSFLKTHKKSLPKKNTYWEVRCFGSNKKLKLRACGL